MKIGSEKRLFAGISFIILVIITIIIVFIRQSQQLTKTNLRVAHTHEVLYHTQKVLSAVIDNEMQTKRSVLEQKNDALPNLERSTQLIFSELAQLKKLTSDNLSQQRKTDTLNTYINHRIAFSQKAVQLNPTEGRKLVMSGEGSSYTDKIRLILEQMQSEENRLLEKRNAENNREAAWLLNFLFMLAAAVLILIGFTLQKLRLDWITHKKTEDILAKQVKLKTVELTEASKRMQEQQADLNALINNTPDMFYSMDTDFNLITFNTAFKEFFFSHLGEETKKGMNMLEYYHPERKEYFLKVFAKIRSGERLSFEDTLVMKGQTIFLDVATNPIFNDNGRQIGIAVFTKNITERKQTEFLLQHLNEKLKKRAAELAASNAELEQFVYIASHDLQEPLRTTSGFIHLLRQEYAGRLDENANMYLTFIAESSKRMKTLIKELLDYSRIGRQKEVQIIDCNKILADVITDLDSMIKETKAIIKPGQLPVMTAYATEMKLLFQNLVNNAIKFRQPDKVPEISVFAEKKRNYWQFAVTDNGIGIDEQYKQRVFIIFQRLHTRNEYDGTGIGLAHCKKIVELHQGEIWVESVPGKGSTFYFTIKEAP